MIQLISWCQTVLLFILDSYNQLTTHLFRYVVNPKYTLYYILLIFLSLGWILYKYYLHKDIVYIGLYAIRLCCEHIKRWNLEIILLRFKNNPFAIFYIYLPSILITWLYKIFRQIRNGNLYQHIRGHYKIMTRFNFIDIVLLDECTSFFSTIFFGILTLLFARNWAAQDCLLNISYFIDDCFCYKLFGLLRWGRILLNNTSILQYIASQGIYNFPFIDNVGYLALLVMLALVLNFLDSFTTIKYAQMMLSLNSTNKSALLESISVCSFTINLALYILGVLSSILTYGFSIIRIFYTFDKYTWYRYFIIFVVLNIITDLLALYEQRYVISVEFNSSIGIFLDSVFLMAHSVYLDCDIGLATKYAGDIILTSLFLINHVVAKNANKLKAKEIQEEHQYIELLNKLSENI